MEAVITQWQLKGLNKRFDLHDFFNYVSLN